MTIEEIIENWGGQKCWRKLERGGWAHKLAFVSLDCEIHGPVVFLCGDFLVGKYHAGLYRQTPFQLTGLPWFVNVCAPGELQIGCERHTFADWKENLDAIAKNCRVNPDFVPRVRSVIELAEAFPGPEVI